MTNRTGTRGNELLPQNSLCPARHFSVSSSWLWFWFRALALATILTTCALSPAPAQETPRGMQKDLDTQVTRGESDDQILQAMVEQYGPTVLVEPPKKGFDLLAWIMPIVVPLIALVLVWEVVRRWRQKAALAPAGGPPVSAEFLARAQREANREPGRENDE